MKTKLLYVVVSSDNDIYLEQAYVSMISAKRYNNDCHITLLVDNLTEGTFIGNRKKMASTADEIIVIDFEYELSAHYRSRLLKTGARKYVKGDFLFIDSDTIITKDLQEIDNQTVSIAACIDSHVELPHNPYRKMIYSHVNAIAPEIDIKNETEYFNSGVIYVKDDEVSHEFYETWQNVYMYGVKKKVKMDQPSFHITNCKLNKVIHILPDIWNCELKHGVKYINSANIIHYLCTNISKIGDEQVFLLNRKDIFETIKQTTIIPEEVYECMENPMHGINDCTTLVAGYDNDMLCTQIYALFKHKYSSPTFFRNTEWLLNKWSAFKALFNS